MIKPDEALKVIAQVQESALSTNAAFDVAAKHARAMAEAFFALANQASKLGLDGKSIADLGGSYLSTATMLEGLASLARKYIPTE